MLHCFRAASRLWLNTLVFSISLAALTAQAYDAPLPASDNSIDTIVVQAKKLDVETLIDRKIYTVTSDVQSTFGSLGDILSIIPSIDVDPDGIVSLRGDTKVLILIDGKPSKQLSGRSAGDAIQSIPAKDIERIEVLTTPPAQFKADGSAGVINIITRTHSEEGTAGSIQGNIGNDRRSTLGANVNYNAGPMTASLSAGYRQDYKERVMQTIITTPNPTAQLTDSSTSIDERIRRDVPTISGSAEFALNERESLSGAISWADRGGLRTYTQLNDSSVLPAMLTSSSRRLSYGHDPETDYDERLGYTQKMTIPGETLELTLHRSISQQDEQYNYIDDTFVPPEATSFNNLAFREHQATTDFSADYSLPLSQARSVKLGYSFEQDDYRFDNLGENLDPLTGAQSVDAALTDDFKFRQRIHSMYASYLIGIERWTALVGLRAEQTNADAVQLTDRVSKDTSYFKVYPSLHFQRELSKDSNLSMGASWRVTRPDPNNLDPYIDYEYRPTLQAGNPNLRPQFTQSYQLGYDLNQTGATYGLTGYFRRNRDSVTSVTQYLGNGVSLTTKENLPKDNSSGLEFSITGHVLSRLSYSVNVNLFYSQIDAAALGHSGIQSTTGLNAKAKLDYQPTPVDSAQLTLTRTDKRLTPQGYISAIDVVNIGYKHLLMGNVTALATVTDLFNGQHSHTIASTPMFTETYRRSTVGRVMYLGIVYSIGSNKKNKEPSLEYDPLN